MCTRPWASRSGGRGWAPAALLLAGLVLAAWLLASPAWAADPAGQMVVQQGAVMVRHEGQATPHAAAPQPVPIYVGDELHSAPNTLAVLTIPSLQDAITLYGGTFFTVGAVSSGESRYGLSLGKAIFKVFAALGAGRNFKVETPGAVVGVKGTEFVLGTDGTDTFLLTLSGVVGMVSQAFLQQEVLASQDFAALARRNQPVSQPVQVSPQVRDQVLKQQGLDAFKGLNLQPGAEQGKKAAEQKPAGAAVGAGASAASGAVSDTQQTLQERKQDVPAGTSGGTGKISGSIKFSSP